MQDIFLFMQHHVLLITAFTAVILALIVLEFIKLKRAAVSLPPAATTRLINHENATVVDIRPTEAYTTGHITDALSIPAADLATSLKRLEKFKSNPIILVCATGMDSSKAASTLQHAGFRVLILAGGIRAWREAELPLIKG